MPQMPQMPQTAQKLQAVQSLVRGWNLNLALALRPSRSPTLSLELFNLLRKFKN